MLKKELNTRFNDFKARKVDFNLFGNPFNGGVVLKWNSKMKIIKLQNDEFIWQKLKEGSFMQFYGTLAKKTTKR